MSKPCHGDNIFAIGGVVYATLKGAKWPREKIEGVMREITSAPSYDDAVEVCRRYITIEDAA